MKHSNLSSVSMLVAAIVAVAGICAQSQQLVSAQEQQEPEGRIVQIGPAGDEQENLAAPEAPLAAELPAYWIGLRGRGVDDPVLRTQLQLAEDMGVVVEDVMPNSPAEKAGLKQHDIILRANGDVVDSMEILQQHVQTGQDKPIELTALRLGKEIDVTVTPEKRPENLNQTADAESGIPGQNLFGGDLGRVFGQLQNGGGLPGGLRVLGPGVLLNGRQFDFNAIPNGMSVSVSRENDGPAKITVKKGEQTWTLDSDDAKALAELPEDVRNYVSGMLNGQNGLQQELGNLDLEAELRHWLPKNLGSVPGVAEFKGQEDELRARMNQLEQQLKELQDKLNADEAVN